MNLMEFIKSLFKSNNNDSLIKLEDVEPIPSRETIKNPQKIALLDTIKKRYLEKINISKNTTITSRDLDSKNFKEEMLMNFELFGRLVINHDVVYNFDTMAEYEKEQIFINQIINPRKIKLYIDKMDEIYSELYLRRIALNEIYREFGKRLSKNKKNAILNEIYNLTSNYIVAKSNYFAALTEVETYKKEINNLETLKYHFGTIKISDIVRGHNKKLMYYAGLLIPDILNNSKYFELLNQIENANNEMKLRANFNANHYEAMASIERELELYTYKNLKIDELNRELEEIDKIEKTSTNRVTLLNRINELEIKYLVLNEFGGHELDLKPLYEVKFDILTIDIINQKDSPFKDIPHGRELKYYEDIIADKITMNITGIDSILNNRLDGENKDLIDNIVNFLKDRNFLKGIDEYNFYYILHDKFKLSLILSMTNDEQLKNFFNNYIVDLNHENIITTNYLFSTHEYSGFNDAFLFTNSITLGNACRIMHFYNEIGHDKFATSKAQSLLRIYKYFVDNLSTNEDNFKLPEGLESIDTDYLMHFEEDIARNYLCKKLNNKTIIMPSTLKYIDFGRRILDKISIPRVVLNEGLEECKGNINFIEFGTKSITIPSTLQSIKISNNKTDNNSFIFEGVEEIIFTNYENSYLLSQEEFRKSMLKELIQMSYLELVQQIKNLGDVLWPNELKLKQYKIVLVSNADGKIVISVDDIVKKEIIKRINNYLDRYPPCVVKESMYDFYKKHPNFEAKIIDDCINMISSEMSQKKESEHLNYKR